VCLDRNMTNDKTERANVIEQLKFKAPSQGKGSLLNYDNAKTPKGEKDGVATAIMYLAPAEVSGYNICPYSTAGCREACLFTAGYGKFDTVANARIARTLRFFGDRVNFMLQLEREIMKFQKAAYAQGFTPVIRLNGTSDIKWERISFVAKDGKHYASMMERFNMLTFYDYTKIPIRFRKNLPANYTLTFSLAETSESLAEAVRVLDKGGQVAAVFGNGLPDTFIGFPVSDGDLSDMRFDIKPSTVIGLKAKGEARKDTSGFVQWV